MKANEFKWLFVALLVLFLAMLALGGTAVYILERQPNPAKDLTAQWYEVPAPYAVYVVEHAKYVELTVYLLADTSLEQDIAMLQALALRLKERGRDALIRTCTENRDNFERAAGCDAFFFKW